MSNWDDEESETEVAPAPKARTAPPVAAARRFEGEDEEDDAPDDWDASSDDEKPAPVASVAPPKKKGTLKAAIAAKEAERARIEAEGAEEESEVDEIEQKRRDKQRELETDLVNASALLAGSSLKGKSAAVDGISNFNPKTKDDFQELSDKLIELIERHQDKPLYATFVELHVKALAQPLKDVDVRKAASGLTTLANEKQKEQRDKAAGKKKKAPGAAKPTLAGGRPKIDTSAYNEALDTFGDDDFM